MRKTSQIHNQNIVTLNKEIANRNQVILPLSPELVW